MLICAAESDYQVCGGGGGGIRTPGTLRHNGFQDRRLKPLGHTSVKDYNRKMLWKK